MLNLLNVSKLCGIKRAHAHTYIGGITACSWGFICVTMCILTWDVKYFWYWMTNECQDTVCQSKITSCFTQTTCLWAITGRQTVPEYVVALWSLRTVYRWTRFVRPNGPCIDWLGDPRKSQGQNEQWDSHWESLNAFQLVVLLTLLERPVWGLFTHFARSLFLQWNDRSVKEVLDRSIAHHPLLSWLVIMKWTSFNNI